MGERADVEPPRRLPGIGCPGFRSPEEGSRFAVVHSLCSMMFVCCSFFAAVPSLPSVHLFVVAVFFGTARPEEWTDEDGGGVGRNDDDLLV